MLFWRAIIDVTVKKLLTESCIEQFYRMQIKSLFEHKSIVSYLEKVSPLQMVSQGLHINMHFNWPTTSNQRDIIYSECRMCKVDRKHLGNQFFLQDTLTLKILSQDPVFSSIILRLGS